MKILKKMSLIFLGIVLVSIILILYFLFRRETHEWTENVTVAPNTEISVELMTSQRGYFGGHGLGWGGGHPKGSIRFEYDGVQYEANEPYTPISIRYYEEDFYIIYYDRETNFNKITFRYFKSTKKGLFKEIESQEFPKQIAIQNRWFDDEENERKVKQLQLDKMRGSLTAKVWYQLETGQNYYEMPDYIPLEFLESYKKENLQ